MEHSLFYWLAQVEYALHLLQLNSLEYVRRHHTGDIWRACLISKIGEKSENGHAHVHIWTKSYLENRTTWRAHSSTKMFAIDSFDNPEEELFLTCTVVTQFERPYLPFLPILAKCDFWRTMALGPC